MSLDRAIRRFITRYFDRLAMDEWITVKPNGKGNKGRHVLLDKDGNVVAGMGGKFKGENIKNVSSSRKSASTPAPAQSGGSAERKKTTKPAKFGGATAKRFVRALTAAKNSLKNRHPNNAWRVSDQTVEDLNAYHKGAVCHVTKGGSTVAVTPDGDIIAVCRKAHDELSGKDILALAVANGG